MCLSPSGYQFTLRRRKSNVLICEYIQLFIQYGFPLWWWHSIEKQIKHYELHTYLSVQRLHPRLMLCKIKMYELLAIIASYEIRPYCIRHCWGVHELKTNRPWQVNFHFRDKMDVFKLSRDGSDCCNTHCTTQFRVPIVPSMCTRVWIERAWLPHWPSRVQQVLHHRWIWGIYCILAPKYLSERCTRIPTKGVPVTAKTLCPAKIVYKWMRPMKINTTGIFLLTVAW